MMMTYQDVLDDLKKRKISPVYLLSGEEEYLKKELEQKIKKILISSSSEVFNYEFLDGEECSAGSLIIKCKTAPFFNSVRLVVVKNADKLCSSKELTEYIQDPLPTTYLILMVKKLPPAFKKYEVKLNKLYPREQIEWIRRKVGEFKKRIDFDAAQLLQELAGENLDRLSSEIEKLILFVGEKSVISKDDVQNIYPAGSNLMSIFDFVDALGNRNKKQALKILKNLVLTEEVGKIFPMIVRQFRLILQSKELLRKGFSIEKISEEIEVKQNWLVRKLLEQSKNFSTKSLLNKFKTLENTELDIKTSKMPPLLSLEILVNKLCS